MSQAIVIAVCGARRAGKDTVAKVLEERYAFVNLKFARYLKDMIRSGFGLTDDEVEGNAKDIIHPVYGVTPRAIMQFIGTDVMQYSLQNILPGVGRVFWANRLLMDVKQRFKESVNRLVISDLRFLHEYEALQKSSIEEGYKLLVIKVQRHQPHNQKDNQLDMHVSEKEWNTIPHDICMDNNTTREAFEQRVINILDREIHI